jgi:uncharacterized protein (TIGR00255 family)
MTFSMTGYGKAVATYQGRIITVEIRTLNSKQGDLNVRMPSIYREREMELRNTVAEQVGRGKVDLSIQRDLADGEGSNQINQAMVNNYYEQLQGLANGMKEQKPDDALAYLDLILQLPDALKPVSEELEDGEYTALTQALDECITAVNRFRAQEGEKLEAVLRDGTQAILDLMSDVEPFEKERIERIRKRILQNLDDADGVSTDKDRFEQELIYYLEKLDVSEEKVRLKAHCEYFINTLQEEGAKGKKLSFISQEMGREINTLGSKAQHSEIQRIVVRMKDELEKIKEQVLNVL